VNSGFLYPAREMDDVMNVIVLFICMSHMFIM